MVTTTERPRAFDPSMLAGTPAPTSPPSWDMGPDRRIDDGHMLATGLAWFSIGLGLAEVLAPERLCEMLGMEGQEELVRLYGFREIATGLGIFSQREPTGWILGRVAGDVLDLATLGTAMTPRNRKRGNVLAAIGAVAGVMALDLLCHRQLTTQQS